MNAWKLEPGSKAGLGLLLVLSTAIFSGVSTFINGYAVQGTNSDAFVTIRNCLVALAVLPLAVLTFGEARAQLNWKNWGRLVLIGLVGGAIPFLLYFHGLELAVAAGGGATASFFYRSLFLMATALGIFLLGERFNLRVLVGAVLLLAGNALLLSFVSPVWVNGTGYVLIATVLWAVEYTISKATMRDLPSGTVALGRMGFGALFLLAYLGVTGEYVAVGHFTTGQWMWVAISAALLTAFVATWYPGLARVNLGTATSVLVLGFPITYILEVAFDGMRVTLYDALGAAAIGAGVVVTVGYVLARQAWRTVSGQLDLPPAPAS